MSIYPTMYARVANLLYSSSSLSSLNRTNIDLLRVQNQISTGKAISLPSEDPVRASAVTLLSSRLAGAEQRARNLTDAGSTLSSLDNELGRVADLVSEARTLASSQVGAQSDASTRTQQASIVSQIIGSLFSSVNRDFKGVYLFGGSSATTRPVEEVAGGYRYLGRGSGLLTDLGDLKGVPVTIGGDNAIGEASARQVAQTDLDPSLSAATSLDDLRGARGLGIQRGTISFSANGGPTATIDISKANNIRDVQAIIRGAIVQYEAANSTTVLTGAGVTGSNGALQFNMAVGATLTFAEVGSGTSAADLGLLGSAFTPAAQVAGDLDPKLTLATPLSAVGGLTLPLGTVRFRLSGGSGSAVYDVDLSGASTIDDVRNRIETSAPGVRLQVSASGRGLDIYNEIAGRTLSVEEVPGGTTAAALGIRTFGATQAVSVLNNGRGVGIVDGKTNPVTGAIDPNLNTDFRITLGNGQWFNVDLVPGDLTNVGQVIARINAAFASAVGTQNNPSAPALAAGQFSAGIVNGPNGLSLTQTVGPGAISVVSQNNSPAADDLGLTGVAFNASSGTYMAQDRSGVRVNNLFSDLIDLRDALLANNSTGITLAGQSLGSNGDRVITAQALVGSYAKRVAQASEVLEDQQVFDTKTKSELEDVDFATAATRFSQLQTQLEASLRTANILGSRTLFDFLS
jgi:flagellin-like hook-associated protein FlgL